jgi:hypothetical protein
MSRGRKERTPAQLDVLAQAREKAKIVIAERAKLNAQAKKEAETMSEDVARPAEAEAEAPPPEPELVPEDSPPPPPEPVSVSEDEDEEPRLIRPKYHYNNGMYIKIK